MHIPFLTSCTYSASVDVSEESVGANIYKQDGKSVSVVASSRLAYGVNKDDVTPDIVAARTLELLEHLLKEEQSRNSSCSAEQIKEVQVTVSSPWYSSTFIESSYKSDQPFHVTEHLINDVSKEANKKTIDTNVYFYDAKIHAVRLNGYVVENALEREATRLDVSIIAHLFNRALKDALTMSLTSLTHQAKVIYIPPGSLYSKALFQLLQTPESYIFIHVRNESTRILLSRESTLADIKDVPFGLYKLLSMADEVETLDEDVLTASQTGWLTEVEGAFRDLASSQTLPRKVYLSVDGDQHAFFISALKKSTLQQLWYSNDPMTINVVDTTALKRYIPGSEFLAQDVTLSMGALLITQG